LASCRFGFTDTTAVGDVRVSVIGWPSPSALLALFNDEGRPRAAHAAATRGIRSC
jgi:hypothetical protein